MRSGALIIDKPAGMTSHDVVGRVRRLYSTRQVGHTGTLDPMATGVLVLLVGNATRASEYLTGDTKSYHANLQLGITTDTQDTTGATLSSSPLRPTATEVAEVASAFLGTSQQMPPMYSALKVGGKKLVDLARQGIEVERKSREITLTRVETAPINVEAGLYSLDVDCSGGTYVRTLCHDIGTNLGCGGAMASLRRTICGGFSLEQAHTLQTIEEMDSEERYARLIPTEELFAHHEILCLPEFYARLAHNGAEIYQAKIHTDYPIGTRVRLYDTTGFFALGEVREYENGSGVKPIKFFGG
ncbi:MAG: tRNA pseudouridine(55) synthase TruB [Oscillospiraceae bacterium]|nr:tRNA pseudouridine(55) synthase TruB [Oscillospiraceae bacterium]